MSQFGQRAMFEFISGRIVPSRRRLRIEPDPDSVCLNEATLYRPGSYWIAMRMLSLRKERSGCNKRSRMSIVEGCSISSPRKVPPLQPDSLNEKIDRSLFAPTEDG